MPDLIVEQLPHMTIAWIAYVLATASPGPSNMSIMGVAMARGRPAALALTAGIVSGSLFWGLLTSLGIASLLTAYAGLLTVIKIIGGLYLLWLAWKSARAAISGPEPATHRRNSRPISLRSLYFRGLALHLTNPKSILAWIAIVSLGIDPAAPAWIASVVVGGCFVLGILIFGTYALAFSSAAMVRVYKAAHRYVEGTLAAIFAAAGIRLLTDRL